MLAMLGYLIIGFLLVLMFVIIMETGKSSYEEGWRSRREERAIEDITDAIRETKSPTTPTPDEHTQFIEIYMDMFNSDQKTAEHAYTHTDASVREAIIRQYGRNSK